MTKNEIINLYISDLNSQVSKSEARDNRISMLQSQLENSEPVDVVLADISTSFEQIDKYAKLQHFKGSRGFEFESYEEWSKNWC
jgi:hypothetical protein